MARRAFLDTHVGIWVATADKRLSKGAMREINSNQEVVMSAISLAELEIKASLNKIKLPSNLYQIFTDNGVTVESFDSAAATQLGRFPNLARHDPFDRMILAQASMKIGTTFFTADEVITSLEYDWVYPCD
jgi:PIN domain nuclease of toxin-antitoxin system